MQWIFLFVVEWTKVVERIAESVEDSPQQVTTDSNYRGLVTGNNFITQPHPLQLSKRHREDRLLPKADDLNGGAIRIHVPYDVAEVSHSHWGALRLDH
jgi:hypothetical protein